MIVKTHLPKTEDIEKIKQIPEHKKANLYLAGFGDQGTHGNMIHSIIGDLNDINFYNIHPATYMLHILGGNKEDIFDFYDIVHSKNKNKGFIDGGNGIDTINLQGIKDKKITVSLSNLKPSDFPEIKNVENLFGTNEDDTIYGNEEDNFLVGNAGNDSIFGENGNDTIIPSIGFDKLNGGKGNDTYLILTKDLINNKIEEIKNNSEIIQNELNKIKEPLNLLNLKYKIILKNTNDIYNKIQNYHSYMSEIKDIYINNIAATNELKELSKKIFAIGNNIYNISTQVKIKLKNYDTPSMNLEKNIDFIIDLNSNLNKLDESIKNNLIKVENFIKSINDFQIQNEDFDSKINKYQSNSFGFDSLSDFNRMMAMQTQSLKSEYIKSQKLNFLNSKNEILSNLNLLYKNLNNISIKSDSMSNEINNIKNKMSLVFDGHKIIDNFDESYLIEKNHGVDIIKTDIKNLISKKEEYNLTLGFNQNNKFIPAIILRDYFKGEKYQHIILTDLSGNIYTNINGSLYQEGLIENTLDVVKLDSENSLIYLDRLENLLVDTKKNIICSNKNETIYGNIFDNFIFGNGGFDKIYGNDGNDTISIEMNSYIKKLESNFEDTEIIENKNYSEINGGSGFDNYILNFNDNYILEDDYNIIIDDYDLNNNMDNLIINDLNSEVKYISFHKSNDVQFGKEMLQINFEDKNNKNYSLFIKNWFKSENYRHLQIQIGKDITITNNLMEQITKSIEDGKNIFSLKIYSKTQSLKKIDSDDGSINYINSENSINEIEEINFKTENNFIKNKIIKISNFEEETIFKLIEKDKLNIFSFVIFKNNQNNSIKKEFKIKINDEIILNKEQLTEYMNTIKLGEIIDISIN
ncbi:hypothetical protein [Silvanigrella sp.]|jgi:hypothetical protein|uniref:hypothetical protein n=1 Tax=Silvanigrella sp. TaxID=2024976 RepID=UPI0037C5C016